MLDELIRANRAEVVDRARLRREERSASGDRQGVLERGIPLLVDRLAHRLSAAANADEPLLDSATRLGGEMWRAGFSVRQVVQAYGDVCQVISELALERRAGLSIAEIRALNDCLGTATSEAVSGYAAEREGAVSARSSERLGFLAHELRNHLHVAVLAWDQLKSGEVATSGSTGAILGKSLGSLRGVVERSLGEVRLEGGLRNEERVSIGAFLDEVALVASFEATARGLELTVHRAGEPAEVTVDRQILASALGNLVQNACKFTRPRGHIALRASTREGRVLLSVADECGGLPPGTTETVFEPFHQRGADRTGLGLGLAISLKAVESSGGRLRVENRPGTGCVFTIDLPLAGAPAR